MITRSFVRALRRATFTAVATAALFASEVLGAAVDPALFSGLSYRMVGPVRGGRVTAVAGVTSQPHTFYMGSTGGGVWKTTDAGANWSNVTDGQIAVGSMGAIEVSESDPNIVYIGTGSTRIRSNVSVGRGVYKSVDAGKTWTFAGLRETGQIDSVRIHPTDPNTVYVAALGNAFAPSKERGVFKTTDGGKTWRNVLFVADSVGAVNLTLQPGSPDVMFVSMWHGQRKPWTIESGSRDGGIYKSTNGGESWTKLGGGLPNEIFGRSNTVISAAAPNRVYALIEAKPGSGLYRSDDLGATWTAVNQSGFLYTRPFYYTTLGIDPTNADIVYVGNEGWFKSSDGGKTFRTEQVPHGDSHAVWINPRNPQYMIQSNDGGANVSLDGGRTWSTQYNQPTAELYQVAVDNQYPYRLYGAQQDNTSVAVPSLPLGLGTPAEWRVTNGGETGPVIPSPTDPNIVYSGNKGLFSRMNLSSNNEQQFWIGAESIYGNGGATLIYRFQRVAPMEISPHDPKVVYFGSQFVHRTSDGGITWTQLSPDLTAFKDFPGEPQQPSGGPITLDVTGEEMYSTLYSIRESTLQKGLIWTGSNDGLIHVTRDDGKTWTNVTPKGLPSGGRVNHVEPSRHRPGTAYAAIFRYLLGDFAPYLYRTDDYGQNWTRLTDGTSGIAADEPTRVVREDPDREGLLYAGTEFGLYISFDRGTTWQSFQRNLPATPVTDIKVTHKDLQLSTQGRGFWIMDNLTPLHQLSDSLKSTAAHLYTPKPALRTRISPSGGFGNRVLTQYPRAGAQIDYFLPKAAEGDVTLEFIDSRNEIVARFTSAAATAIEAAPAAGGDDEDGPRRAAPIPRLAKTAGQHRFTWDIRYPGAWVNEATPAGPNGPFGTPGQYTVRLTANGTTLTQPLTVLPDPRVAADGITQADFEAQFEHNIRTRNLVSDANKVVAKVRAAQAGLKEATGANAQKLAQIDAIAAKLITPSIRYSRPGLQTHITYLYGMTARGDQPVGKDAKDRYEVLRQELDTIVKELTPLVGPVY